MKYKVGDRVVCTDPHPNNHEIFIQFGDRGIITKIRTVQTIKADDSHYHWYTIHWEVRDLSTEWLGDRIFAIDNQPRADIKAASDYYHALIAAQEEIS